MKVLENKAIATDASTVAARQKVVAAEAAFEALIDVVALLGVVAWLSLSPIVSTVVAVLFGGSVETNFSACNALLTAAGVPAVKV